MTLSLEPTDALAKELLSRCESGLIILNSLPAQEEPTYYLTGSPAVLLVLAEVAAHNLLHRMQGEGDDGDEDLDVDEES